MTDPHAHPPDRPDPGPPATAATGGAGDRRHAGHDDPTVVSPADGGAGGGAGGTHPNLIAGSSWLESGGGGRSLGTLGRYRIIRKIGEGGMGAVYEAEQDRPKRTVALKVIRTVAAGSPGAKDTLRRFELEAQALARLQHPGIAQVYDAGLAPWVLPGRSPARPGEDAPTPYFAMELVHGRPLLAHAAALRLDARHRLELLARIADAVHHAHQKGVIHRDLKPGNVLVVEDDAAPSGVGGPRVGGWTGVGQPKILDFGVARFTDADRQATLSRTDVGQLIGTLPYMSPEQVTGDPDDLDTRSDVYALGVMLYELVAGVLPYDVNRKAMHEAVRIIQQDEPTRLSRVNRDLRGDAETIALKALEKEKSRRYQSASDLAADIRRFLNDEPIDARPASAAYQFSKFAKRNRAWVGAGAVAALALVAAVVASAGFAVNESRARRSADTAAARADAVTAFVQDMLSAANPQRAQGRDVSVREALDEASKKLDAGELKDQPLVELGVRTALSRTYLGLGLPDKVWPQLDAGRRLMERLTRAGEQPPLRARLEQSDLRGTTLQYEGKLAEAEAVFRESLAVIEHELGPSAREAGPAANNLGVAVAMQGRMADAEPLLRRALAINRRWLGPDAKESLDALTNLASILDSLYKADEAEQLTRESMDRRIRVMGEKHPDTIIAIGNYAVMLSRGGGRGGGGGEGGGGQGGGTALARSEQALPYYRRVLDLTHEVMGPDHADTLSSMSNLAQLLLDLGQADEAERLQRETLEGRRRVLGDAHPDTLDSMNNLGHMLRARGATDEAEAMLRRALELGRAAHGPDNADVLRSACALAEVLTAGQKVGEARALLDDALPRAERVLTDDNGWTARVRLALAQCLLAQQELEGAESQAQRAYATFNKLWGPDAKLALQSAGVAAQVADARGHPADAAAWRAKSAVSAPGPRTPAAGPTGKGGG